MLYVPIVTNVPVSTELWGHGFHVSHKEKTPIPHKHLLLFHSVAPFIKPTVS